MIVDGENELLGNGIRDAQQAIQQASQREKIPISISMTRTNNNAESLQVRMGSIPGASDQNRADVWLAIAEQSLHANVKGGENGGMSWEHASVARLLQKIGSITHQAPLSIDHRVKFRSDWKQENLRIVIFAQDRRSRKVLGATSRRVLEAEQNE